MKRPSHHVLSCATSYTATLGHRMANQLHRIIADVLFNPRAELVKEIKRLLESGEDANYRDSSSRTPLDYCVLGDSALGAMNAGRDNGKGKISQPHPQTTPQPVTPTNHTLSILQGWKILVMSCYTCCLNMAPTPTFRMLVAGQYCTKQHGMGTCT